MTIMASPSEEGTDTFVNLSSNQERLMKEMNAYLAAISAPSPGEETTCSVETRRADNHSSYDSSVPLSDRLKVPSCSDDTPTDIDNDGISREGLDGPRKKEVTSRRKNSSLNAIDEDGVQDNTSSAQQYEYFNDFDRNSSHGSNNFEEDSLIAMAKRMDAASIVSDPSMIVGPSEKFLALPQPKKLMKKLGQKMQMQANKPAPTPRSNVAKVSPKPPQRRLSQKMKNYQNSGSMVSVPFSSETDDVSNLSETNHTGKSTISTDSPSSTKENAGFGPENIGSVDQGNDKKYNRFSSLESENSVEDDDLKEVAQEQQQPVPEKKPARAVTPKGSRRKSALKKSSKDKDNKDNESKKSRRESGKKQSSRRTSPRLSTSPIDQRPVGGDYNADYLPANLKQQHVTQDEVMEALRKCTKKKSNRRDSGEKQKRKKDRSKKRQQKQQSDSDDEPMRGVGFNTRINDKTKDGTKPNVVVPDQKVPKQSGDDIKPKSNKSDSPPPQRADSMQGKGFNTRARDSNNNDARPNIVPERKITKQSRDDAQKKSSHVPTRAANNTNAERQTSYQYESYSEGETSGYSSDDQTQIFYESTDDEDFTDSDDEPLAVGTSVADAVNDLNNKRALTKVKNLFGRRG